MLVRAGFIVYRSRKRDGEAHLHDDGSDTHNIKASPAETENSQSIFTSSQIEPDILKAERNTCQDAGKKLAASKRGRKGSNKIIPNPAKKQKLGYSGSGGLTD
jgi:hypothetical protein